MGAVGGVAILGGNFEAPTFPEDKVVQRSLTAGTQESSAIDAIILDALPLGAPGQLDSHAFLWKGHSNDGSPHSIDWKAFVNVTADDGTGSLWTLQTRIDGAPYTDILTVDDNGLLTVSGATFTMDQLIIDSDNTEAVLIRKDGDAGDVFIVDTVNDVVRMGSDDTLFTFGAASDVILERVSARVLQMNSVPLADTDNELRIVARDDVNARYLSLFAAGTNQARVAAQRAGGGGRFDLELFTSSGSIEIWTDNVQRWNFGAGSGGFDFELLPIITNRYDIGTTLFAVRDVFTNRVFIGQDQIAAFTAITIDHADLTGDANQDSGSILLTGKGFETATPHDIDWKFFVNVTADDGTGSIFTLQTQIDTAGFVTVFEIDDAGNLTIPGSFTVDGLIIDVDSTEAFLVRKDGDGGDVFIIDTINEQIMMSSASSLCWSTDVRLWREDPGVLALRDGTNDQFFYIYATFTDSSNYERLALYAGGQAQFFIETQTAGTGQDDAILDIRAAGSGGQILLKPGASSVTYRFFGSQFSVSPTNTLDLGLAGSGYFRNAFFGTSVTSGLGVTTGDAFILDTAPLGSPGVRDSLSVLWTGKSHDGSPHDVDWKAFVAPVNNDGTGSLFTISSRIDAVGFVDEFTITSTTSPTLVTIGPGSTGAALAFGPLGTDGPATTGTIRLKNLDTIVIRNAQDDDDHFILESLVSDEFNMFDPNIGRVDFLEGNSRFFKRVEVHVDGTSTSALSVGGIFIVDTTNRLIRLAQDDAVLTWGTASDAQMHRDAADIIAQRRGLNPQEWRLYDRFVSLSDYDRLAIYIGGGPPVKTIEFVAESTGATQGINIEIESLANAFGDGSLTLKAGTSGATFFCAPAGAGAFMRYTGGEFQINTVSGMRVQGLILSVGGSISTAGIGMKLDIAGQGAAAFEDSHSIDMIGAGQNANRATWRTFVDVQDITGNSIWTLQNDLNGGGFVNNLTINNDGDFNLFGKVKIAVDDAEAFFIQKAGGGGPGQDIFKIDTSASGFPPGNMVRLTGALFRQEISQAGNTFGTSGGLDYVFLRVAPSQVISGGASDEAHILLFEGNIQGFSGDTARINVATFTGSVTTQNVAEAVASISQVQIDEPTINLQGSSTVTEAQSLLITGAPTEGVRNYALNILGGDLAVDDSSAILFNFGSSDRSALSIAPTGRLEIGLSADPWARITLYSPVVTAVGILRVEANAADHGAQTDMQTTFADVATSAGSSVTAASLIPAGSFVIGVTVRVLTTVTGPTGFDVGDGIDVDRWGNSILVAAGTVTNIQSFTSGSVTTFPAANDVVITSDGVDFTGGSIRITVHYTQLQTSAA